MGSSEEEDDSPLDFSAPKKIKIQDTKSDKEIIQDEDASSRLRHILSMKAQNMAPEDLAGTILNLSKKSFDTATWLNSEKYNPNNNTTSSSNSNSPVSDRPTSAFSHVGNNNDRSVPASSAENNSKSFPEGIPVSLPNFHPLGFSPFGLPSFSPDLSPLGLMNGNGAALAMPFPTSPNAGTVLVEQKVDLGPSSPEKMACGAKNSNGVQNNASPAVNTNKGRTTRPFKVNYLTL